MLAFPLNDGRLQIIAGRADPGHCWTCTKSTAEPEAIWSAWSQLATPDRPDAAVMLPDGVTQLFGTGGAGYRIGPYPRCVTSSWTTSARPDAGWTPWTDFYRDADGGALHDPQAVRLPDGGVLIALRADDELQALSFAPGFGGMRVPTHQSSLGLRGVLSHTLVADGRGCLHLFAVTADGSASARWAAASGSPLVWSPWRQLAAGSGRVRAARLSDGRIQLWGQSATPSQSLWTRWTLASGDAQAWAQSTPFGPPEAMLPGPVDDFCVGPLSDGRLQIVVRSGERYVTCWKMLAAPDAPWSSWAPFEAPPR